MKSGKTRSEAVFGVTSLEAVKGTPARLLELNRGHWSVENKSHYVRDVAFDEDKCRARRGFGPAVLATLRNGAISTLKLVGVTSVAAGLRACAANPAFALRALGVASSP